MPTKLIAIFSRTFFAFLLLVVSSLVHAQIGVAGPSVPRPRPTTCTNVELSQRLPCPDSELFFSEGQAPVQRAFNAKDYKGLDELYDRWCTGDDRFPDGRWKLMQYEVGLYQSFMAWNAWTRDLGVIKSWQAAVPQSPAARYSEAVYWHAFAWKARGEGYAASVSKEGWELFRERLGQAMSALDSAQISSSRCPAPDALRLNLMVELGATEKQLVSLYANASRKYPQYHGIYFSMARYFDPRWGGTPVRYETFARQATEQTKTFEGSGMYARLYWLVDQSDDMPFRNDPARPPSWNRLRAGYDDLVRLYPSSIHNIGKYAGVACRSSDGELYRTLRGKIAGYENVVEMVDSVDVCDRRHHWATK